MYFIRVDDVAIISWAAAGPQASDDGHAPGQGHTIQNPVKVKRYAS